MTGARSPGSRPRRLSLSRWSVRSRILASLLLVAALGLVGAEVTNYLVQRTLTLSDVDARLVSRVALARSVVTRSENGFSTSSEALRSVLAGVLPNSHEDALGIVNGRVQFYPDVVTDIHLENDTAFAAQVVREVGTKTVWLGTTDSQVGPIRYIAVPISVAGDPQSAIYVAAVSMDQELAPLNSSLGTFAIIAVVALLAIGLVGWFVAGRLLRPIRQLDAAASRITASDRRERIPVVGTDDVSELTGTINDMLDRLDSAMTGQRQLLDDVRHELKTPITIIRGHLELLDVSDAEEVAATRALALDELDRMSGLVDDIEALADTQRGLLAIAPVDVADLTADVFAKVQGLRGHDWMLVETAQARAELDAARITQGWLQLVDNAAKYSPPGSTIELGSRLDGDEVEFWVRDSGPGIPDESLQRIFDRFGRVDTGRGIHGSGLGLPIVKAIAEGHGGRVSLDSGTSGSRFGIVVPVGSPQGNEGEESDA
ncbi:MAG: two-component system, OmpR family, sensor kinase [Actinomycetota bacterium]|jgi:signal transduction histidine kinase|nr:two-component system, OmpR family, sensor kinase [Actinomycetota bacterium]